MLSTRTQLACWSMLLCLGTTSVMASERDVAVSTRHAKSVGEATTGNQSGSGGRGPVLGGGTPDLGSKPDAAKSTPRDLPELVTEALMDAVSGSSTVAGSFLAKAPFTLLPGDIFFTQDNASPGIVRVDPMTGGATAIVTTPALSPQLSGIAVDGNGRVLVTIQNPPELLRIDPATGVVSSLRLFDDSTFYNASDVAVEANGNILVATEGVDGAPPAIIRYDPVGDIQTDATDGLFDLDGQFIGGIAVESAGSIIFSVPALQEVRRIDPMTTVDTVLSSAVNLSNPTGVAIAPNGHVIVADPGFPIGKQSALSRATPKGPPTPNEVISINPISGVQTVISTDGLLSDPFDVAIEGDGAVLVANDQFSATASIVRLAAGTFTQSTLSTPLDNMRRLSVAPCAPTITTVTPSNIPAGDAATRITVAGSCFNTTSVVSFNGTPLGTTFVSPTSLQATVPAVEIETAGSFDVIVTNTLPTAGVSAAFPVSVADPSITSLAPPSVCAGDPNFISFDINGANFAAGAEVQWNGSPLATTFGDSTMLSAEPAGLQGAVGMPTITVVNNPGGVTSMGFAFNVVGPSISGLNPPSVVVGGPDFPLVVTGGCFVTGSAVSFNGQTVATVVNNGMQVTGTIPAALISTAGTVPVQVLNPGGSASAPFNFDINNPAPTVTSLSPDAASIGDIGFVLTVNGTGFVPGATVLWDGAALGTNFVSNAVLNATVTATELATVGFFDVTVLNPLPGGTQSNPATFTVTAASTISSLAPNAACVAQEPVPLTVTGSDFVAGSQIVWGNATQPTTFVDASTLTTQIASSLLQTPGFVPVSVVGPGGSLTETIQFTINGPAIGGLTPSSAAAGGPDFELRVSGDCLVESSLVLWDAQPLSTNFILAGPGTVEGTLRASVPASRIASEGTAVIKVRNSSQAVSPGSNFSVVAPAVGDLSVTAETTGGDGVTITVAGQNFVPGSTVLFAGQPVSTTFLGPNLLRAVIPSSLLKSNPGGMITVESPGGSRSGEALLPLVHLTSSLPNGRVGSTYGAALNAAGGVPPYAWSVSGGSLHQGLSINAAGSISGVPVESGDLFVTIEVADVSGQSASRTVALSVLGLFLLNPTELSIDLTPNAAVVTRTVSAAVGGGSVEIEAAASTASGDDWLSVSPATATASAGSPATTTVTIDSEGLPVGVHIGQVSYGPANGSPKGLDVPATSLPVIVTVNPTATLFQLSQAGLQFTAVAGSSNPPAQTFSVGNIGVGDLAWTVTASAVSDSQAGPDWLSASPENGTSTAGNPLPDVSVVVDTEGLEAGQYYGQVEVRGDETANSPQVVTVVLNLLEEGAEQAGPAVEPLGLLFVAPEGGEPPAAEEIEMANVSGGPITFTSMRVPESGSDPFSHTPAAGSIEPGATAAISVNALPGVLAPGEYRSTLELSFSNGVVRSAELLLLITPETVAPLSESTDPTKGGQGACKASGLVGNFTSLGQGFTAPAAWPSTISIEVADDCGASISDGSVVASFSVGGSLALVSLGDGHWENSWVPATDAAGVVSVSAEMESGSGLKGIRELTGSVAVNDAPPPHVVEGAIVGSASFDPELPLTPGTLVTIFGTNLALAQAAAPTLPLPLQLGGATVQSGGRALPLLFASPGQINALIPYELPANTSQQVIVRRGNTISGPVRIALAEAQPDVFALAGREAIAVDINGNLITTENPVAPGGVIVIFAAGLGPVAPGVTSGDAAPLSPLAFAAGEVTVTIGELPATVFFAGLTPGFAGLYQINAFVAEGTPTGDAIPIVVQVGDAASRAATVAVR